jgi:hypothetical protein
MNRVLLQKISRLIGYRKMEAKVKARLPRSWKRRQYRKMVRKVVRGPRPAVLVYTMSKVASTAVTEALRSIEGLRVFQIHFICPDSVNRLRQSVLEKGFTKLEPQLEYIEDVSHALTEELIKPGHRVKVIALVREPVGRNISYYFQALDDIWQTPSAHRNVELERLVAEYHDRINHQRAINWFDNEFKPVLGIDVYAHPFPRDKGFLRITSGPYEVLLMRHDLDDRLKEKCLAELIGVPAVSLTPKNVGTQKVYSSTYTEFLKRIRLSEDYVDRMLGSKYARHFYSAEELARLRAKWLGNGRTADSLEYV